jgi:hypothetical protein
MISLMAHFGNQDCLIKKIAQGNLFAEDCKAKGQLISKGNVCVFHSPKKRT